MTKQIKVNWFKRQLHKLPGGCGRSRDRQRLSGKWFVLYKDGMKSENMFYDTAKDYAKIFGGKVKHICFR